MTEPTTAAGRAYVNDKGLMPAARERRRAVVLAIEAEMSSIPIRLTIDAPECVEAIRRVKEEADEWEERYDRLLAEVGGVWPG